MAKKITAESNAMRYTYKDLKIGDRVKYPLENGGEDEGIVIGIHKYFYTVAGTYYNTSVWRDRSTPINVVRAIEDAEREAANRV